MRNLLVEEMSTVNISAGQEQELGARDLHVIAQATVVWGRINAAITHY